MAKPTKTPKTSRKTIRNRSYEDMGSLVRTFLDAGADEIHTNRTIAQHMFGVDNSRITESHIRKARALVEKMLTLGLPLCPCGPSGELWETDVAHEEACRGLPRRYRFDPHGSILGESFREAMGQIPRIVLAIGVVALEGAVIDAGYEEAGALLEVARGAIPPEDFVEAERELARRRAEGPSRLRRGRA